MNTWEQCSGILTGSSMAPSSVHLPPDIFYQVFTVHVFKAVSIIPVLYASLPNKQHATYERMLTATNTMHDFDPMTVVCCVTLRWLALIVPVAYPRVSITGCFSISSNLFIVRFKNSDCGLNIMIQISTCLSTCIVGSFGIHTNRLCCWKLWHTAWRPLSR